MSHCLFLVSRTSASAVSRLLRASSQIDGTAGYSANGARGISEAKDIVSNARMFCERLPAH